MGCVRSVPLDGPRGPSARREGFARTDLHDGSRDVSRLKESLWPMPTWCDSSLVASAEDLRRQRRSPPGRKDGVRWYLIRLRPTVCPIFALTAARSFSLWWAG